mgnify:CR=1 FL=1|tara:strand:+ start:389 stop:634 length:246 start_codon:yes stop_codon:yes gene_type:complete
MTNINTIDDLRQECLSDKSDFFICLNGGLRSSKTIYFCEDDGWEVCHEISDSWEEYKTDEDFREGCPFLFEAMEKEAFYKR